MRSCIKCDQNKEDVEFRKDKKYKSGISNICNICANERQRLYHEQNGKELKIKRKLYYHNKLRYSELHKKRAKIYRAKNKDKAKQYFQKWCQNNRHKLSAIRKKWKKNNKEKYKQFRVKYTARNRERLDPVYIRSLLVKHYKFTMEEVYLNPELVTFLQIQVKIKRLLNKKKNDKKNTKTS